MAERFAGHWLGWFVMPDLLTSTDLPPGFVYPGEFIRVVELGLVRLEPWWILDGDVLRRCAAGLSERYPARSLVPFATRQDNDDVACFVAEGPGVDVIHDFASPGWEHVATFENFNHWFRKAIEDFVEFGEMEVPEG